MTTLFDATLALARKSGGIFEGKADSGTTTTLVDAQLKTKATAMSGGTVWFKSGDNNGESAIVNTSPQNKLVFDALDHAIVAGVEYAVLPDTFPRDVLARSVNLALQDIPAYTEYNITLEIVGDQEEYTLPDGVENVVSIEEALAAEVPYNWCESFQWKEIIGGKIRFMSGWALSNDGNKIRIGYNQKHGWMVLDSDVLNSGVNIARLSWESLVHCYRSRIKKLRTTAADDPIEGLLNEAKDNAAKEEPHVVMRVNKPAILSGW